MKKIFLLLIVTVLTGSTPEAGKVKTYCNPMNLNYRFQGGSKVAYREAADPSMTRYKDKYILYVSHSGGYWQSVNLLDWDFIPVTSLPIEDYAPDAITINDTTYFTASAAVKKPICYTTNPLEDKWKPMDRTLPFPVWDPHFFVDDNGKRYLYWGCSNTEPIKVVELDKKMRPIGEPRILIQHNAKSYGWENPGEMHQMDRNGYNEGAWMTRYNGRYYLQYAAPGTEFKVYADGVYTSDSPEGPFKYEEYSPFSYKPGGFAGGAGHSSTFADKYGNYWHISTLSISRRHMFERRLALFPAAFDKDGVLRTFTAFGDYPTIVPDHRIDFEHESLFRGWMLLSYMKKITASSSEDDLPPEYAADEDIRTWWSARTGNPGEFLTMDLGEKMTVNAIQLNFADNESQLKPENRENYYCYKILTSDDGKSWKVLVDKSNNSTDACHDYIDLEKPATTRYIKVENVRVPDGKFSVYDLRVFGTQKGRSPGQVAGFDIRRDKTDSRKATVRWEGNKSATGYIVNYGTDINKLYTQVMVYDADSLMLAGLNKDVTYYFSIDAFNESGITKGEVKLTGKCE